ncbi:glycosyltransferase family A protein [Paraburkholderia diazotrophica]|uniref:glycosyltransferase family 2 protein n=1 Tax=Paraburkholderia diazotrophica TaxID=667676 RepID=UPI003170DCAA
MPLVTVLMPVYNGAAYLRSAIQSILDQTFKDFEFLIIDDGSVDGTAEILAYFARLDRRVRILAQENAGIVVALNRGMAEARGTYLARMDADDVAAPTRLELQVAEFERDVHLVACGSDFIKFGTAERNVKMPKTHAQCNLFQLIKPCFAHPSVMLRMEVMRKNDLFYAAEYTYAEDYKLWSDLAPLGTFHNISRPLLRYRLHPAQIGATKVVLQRAMHLRVATENFARLKISIDSSELESFLWPADGGGYGAVRYLLRAGRFVCGLLMHRQLREFYFLQIISRIFVVNLFRTVFKSVTIQAS